MYSIFAGVWLDGSPAFLTSIGELTSGEAEAARFPTPRRAWKHYARCMHKRLVLGLPFPATMTSSPAPICVENPGGRRLG